jgi:ABC-2 type transport system ATP-binding protein
LSRANPRESETPLTHASAAIETRGLVKNYDKVAALRGIDLTVNTGEMFALLGPNGAGKTTLFSILATLRKPSAGEARVMGHDVVQERARVRRRMGIVFQEPALEQKLSVRDNLLLMGLFYSLPLKTARRRVGEIMQALGLADIADRPAQKLSGGQKRRLELARSMVPDPDVLFLDEATLGLDVEARRQFWAQVRQFVRSGRTVFFTTHYMEEADVADRIALINQGQIIALGTPRELKNRIGGGVILLATEDDARAQSWLSEHGHKPEASERGIVLVSHEPAAVLPALLTTMPVKTLRAEVHEPSLEDVFLTLTGKTLDNGEATPAGSAFVMGGAR